MFVAGQSQESVPQSESKGAGGQGARGTRSGEPGRRHRQTEKDPGGARAGSAGGRESTLRISSQSYFFLDICGFGPSSLIRLHLVHLFMLSPQIFPDTE